MRQRFSAAIERLIDRYFPTMEIAEAPVKRAALACLEFPAVYFLCNHEGPFYVGCSAKVGRRIVSHLDLGPITDKILIVRTRTWDEAYYLETLFLDKLQPALNKRKREYGERYVTKRMALSLRKLFRRLLREI